MRIKALVAAGVALSLAACAQTAKLGPTATHAVPAKVVAPAPPAFTPTPGLTARDRQRKAVELLGTGQSGQARAELIAVLGEQPGNAAARKLLDQIDKEPRVLLGEKNYPYKVRPGESLSVLADRLLGDSLMFYGLARYNGIADPSQMEVGRTLLIPGAPRKAAPAKPAAAAPAPPRNPARAAQLRGQALEQMNRGGIHQAVGLLQQALALDPGNPAIQKDLERAQRIKASVQGRP